MPLPKDQAWFPAKTYGWGWGIPSRWQGWVVFLGFIGAIAAGAPLAKQSPLIYVVYCCGLGAVLGAIAYWKGEKPRWSWGNRE
ncbi:MAG: hypothetical protein ABIZ81_15705 [Opitutaceae bacterium]